MVIAVTKLILADNTRLELNITYLYLWWIIGLESCHRWGQYLHSTSKSTNTPNRQKILNCSNKCFPSELYPHTTRCWPNWKLELETQIDIKLCRGGKICVWWESTSEWWWFSDHTQIFQWEAEFDLEFYFFYACTKLFVFFRVRIFFSASQRERETRTFLLDSDSSSRMVKIPHKFAKLASTRSLIRLELTIDFSHFVSRKSRLRRAREISANHLALIDLFSTTLTRQNFFVSISAIYPHTSQPETSKTRFHSTLGRPFTRLSDFTLAAYAVYSTN